jgi:hypothetical protein
MLAERVARLEQIVQSMDKKLSSIELALARIEGQLAQLPKAADIGELKGKVDSKPNSWQMLGMQLTTLMAGAGIVFAALRILKV